MSDEETAKKWAEPATRADIVTAMIRMQNVSAALLGVISATASRDNEKISEKLAVYQEKFSEALKFINEMSGWENNE